MESTKKTLTYFTSPYKRKGQDPQQFGPHLWFVLHVLAYHAPDNEKMVRLTMGLSQTLMCVYCRISMQAFLKCHSYPSNDNTNTWGQFWNHLHNWVNEKLGKTLWLDDDNAQIFGCDTFRNWEEFEEHFWFFTNALLQHTPHQQNIQSTIVWVRHERLKYDYEEIYKALVDIVKILPKNAVTMRILERL